MSMTGADIADGMLDVSRPKLPDGCSISGTAEHLAFPHRSFDLVLCVSVYAYVDLPPWAAERGAACSDWRGDACGTS